MMATTARTSENFDSREGLHYYSAPLKVISGTKFGLYTCSSSRTGEMSSNESLPHDASLDNISPAVSGAQRAREKAKAKGQTQNGQAPKAKTAKDKRKLREKRRPTGVIRIPPSGSTGDSFEDDSEPPTSSFEAEPNSPTAELERNQDGDRTPDAPAIVVQSVSFVNDKETSDDAEDEDGNLLSVPFESAPVVPPIPSNASTPNRKDVDSQVVNPRLSSLVSRFEQTSSETANPPSSYRSRQKEKSEEPSFLNVRPLPRSTRSGARPSMVEQNNNSVTPPDQELAEAKDKIEELNKQNAALQKLVEKIQTEALTQKLNLQRALREKEEEASLLSDRVHCQESEIIALSDELRILDKDLEQLDDDNMNLVEENKALYQSLKTLTHQQ